MVCLVMDDCFTHSGFILQSFVQILELFLFAQVFDEEEQEIINFLKISRRKRIHKFLNVYL